MSLSTVVVETKTVRRHKQRLANADLGPGGPAKRPNNLARLLRCRPENSKGHRLCPRGRYNVFRMLIIRRLLAAAPKPNVVHGNERPLRRVDTLGLVLNPKFNIPEDVPELDACSPKIIQLRRAQRSMPVFFIVYSPAYCNKMFIFTTLDRIWTTILQISFHYF